ncbi:MAG: DUF4293 family protein [Bacteroidetes bacterium]|nr:DUF4293 family protein [Bacteroidota bacterium]
MIQRIQSLLLLAVAGISAALFFIPLSEKAGIADATGISSINTLNINEVTSKVGIPSLVYRPIMALWSSIY